MFLITEAVGVCEFADAGIAPRSTECCVFGPGLFCLPKFFFSNAFFLFINLISWQFLRRQ